MKINMSADKKYINETIYVLNRIKYEINLNEKNNQNINYMFDLNIDSRSGIDFYSEKKVLQILKDERVITEIGETTIAEIGEKDTPQYKAYEIYHFRVSKKFLEYYDKYQKTQNFIENYCWFDNNTFFLLLQDNSVKAISFDTERGNRQVLTLFQTLVEHWKLNGDTPITANDIVQRMSKLGSSVPSKQLKNTMSNIRRKKIKPANLQNKIQIKYDSKAGGWRININR